MNNGNITLSGGEKATFSLRGLYENYGYSRYKMSKFEEYDLYVRTGDALISEGVITFTDTNGKLMALKPDVTLSIIKNSREGEGLQKVYYNENVYRVSKGTQSFKEIMQVGLECMGDIDDYCVLEVVELAAKSLLSIDKNCVLDISHLGVISEILEEYDLSKEQRRDIIKCVGEKNLHELKRVCALIGMDDGTVNLLGEITGLCGAPKKVLPRLEALLSGRNSEAVCQLKGLTDAMSEGAEKIVNIDFSVTDDVSYYNGIVFKGFIRGVPCGVLSGGRYDKLMKKMGKAGGAIGFAVYLDMLERLNEAERDYDADTLIIYTVDAKLCDVKQAAEELRKEGKSVAVLKDIPSKAQYRRIIKIDRNGVEKLENNA